MTIFSVNIESYNPVVTDLDRENGYMVRYFVSRANQIHKAVYEVSDRQYDDLIWKGYVVGGHLNWIIKGPLDNYKIKVYTGVPWNGGYEDIGMHGIKTQNQAAVNYLSEKIPILKNTITIFDQFYIGI